MHTCCPATHASGLFTAPVAVNICHHAVVHPVTFSSLPDNSQMLSCQAYEERRRKKDAEREAAEAAQEAELARAAAARYAKQEAEAAEWMGQISLEEQGQQTDEQHEGQASSAAAAHVYC